MSTRGEAIDVGFAVLRELPYPATHSRGPGIEFALRGTLQLGEEELHPDAVLIRSMAARPPASRPSTPEATLLAITLNAEAVEVRPLLERIQRAEVIRIPALAQYRLEFENELRSHDGMQPLALAGLVMHLLADCVRRVGYAPSAPIGAVTEMVDREFRHPLRLADIAARTGVRPTTLASRFRREMGMTVGAYVRQRRIDFARRLLLETDAPVAEVARAAGFYDEAHLNRCFRQATGTTPAAFRRGARG